MNVEKNQGRPPDVRPHDHFARSQRAAPLRLVEACSRRPFRLMPLSAPRHFALWKPAEKARLISNTLRQSLEAIVYL